jgi:hypothetical protein
MHRADHRLWTTESASLIACQKGIISHAFTTLKRIQTGLAKRKATSVNPSAADIDA